MTSTERSPCVRMRTQYHSSLHFRLSVLMFPSHVLDISSSTDFSWMLGRKADQTNSNQLICDRLFVQNGLNGCAFGKWKWECVPFLSPSYSVYGHLYWLSLEYFNKERRTLLSVNPYLIYCLSCLFVCSLFPSIFQCRFSVQSVRTECVVSSFSYQFVSAPVGPTHSTSGRSCVTHTIAHEDKSVAQYLFQFCPRCKRSQYRRCKQR